MRIVRNSRLNTFVRMQRCVPFRSVSTGPKFSLEPMLDHRNNSWATLFVLRLVLMHGYVCHGRLFVKPVYLEHAHLHLVRASLNVYGAVGPLRENLE